MDDAAEEWKAKYLTIKETNLKLKGQIQILEQMINPNAKDSKA